MRLADRCSVPVLWASELLLLRPLALQDDGAVHALIADPLVCRYMPLLPSMSLATSRAYVAACLDEAAGGRVLSWAVVEGGAGLIGIVQGEPRVDRVELGFFLHSGHWGRGVMTAALGAALGWLDGRFGRPAVACCDGENGAAGRLLLRLGFQPDGWGAPRVHPALGPLPRPCRRYRRG